MIFLDIGHYLTHLAWYNAVADGTRNAEVTPQRKRRTGHKL
jgi:hypothetical protein